MRPLIKLGLVNVDARERFERTALHRACFRGNVDMIQILLEIKADIDAQDAAWDTPLHTAIGYRNMDAAILLLEHHGANPAAENRIGLTPLELARTGEELAALVLC